MGAVPLPRIRFPERRSGSHVNRDPKFRYATEKNLKGKGLKKNASGAEVSDETYVDGLICRDAEKALRNMEKIPPFFLAVGLNPTFPLCPRRNIGTFTTGRKFPFRQTRDIPRGLPSWRYGVGGGGGILRHPQ